VLGSLDIHYSNAKHKVDTTRTITITAELEDGPIALNWDNAVEIDFSAADLATSPMPGTSFAELPAVARRSDAYQEWSKDLSRWITQKRPLVLYHSRRFNMTSSPDETQGAFRARLAQSTREERDLEIEKLRKKYSARFITLKNRMLVAEQAIAREQEQSKSKKMETAISFGTAILSAFLGRKALSATSASRMGTAMKSASRMGKEGMDVARAQERAQAVQIQLEELELLLAEDIDKLETSYDPAGEELEEIRMYPKKSDIRMKVYGLTWMPYRKDIGGSISPDWQ